MKFLQWWNETFIVINEHRFRKSNAAMPSLMTVCVVFFSFISRFRVLKSEMNHFPEKAEKIVYSCTILHNLLVKKRPGVHLQDIIKIPITKDVYDISWHDVDALESLQKLKGNNSTDTAKVYRDHLKRYYFYSGSVPWQEGLF